jgi:IS30 family transposase
MRTYTQLTREERYQIYGLRQVGCQQSKIAQVLGRHKATISRELRRNRGLRGYRPKQAHRMALARRAGKSRARFTAFVWDRVEALIRKDWSPEQICGRLEAEQGIRISHEYIYLYIYADKRSGGNLHQHLRCQKQRRKRYGSYDRRGIIPNRISIDERPSIVDTKGRFGDWEGDTVIGKHHRGALITLVERKSLYTVIGAVCRKRLARCVKSSWLDLRRTKIGFTH